MSTVEERLRQQEAARAARRKQDADGTGPKPTAPTVKDKLVRKTVDLPPVRYTALTQWCNETATTIGVTRVTGQAVINALIARLLTDETMAHRIRADLADELT
jgi:hypothetical protein